MNRYLLSVTKQCCCLGHIQHIYTKYIYVVPIRIYVGRTRDIKDVSLHKKYPHIAYHDRGVTYRA